MNNIPKQLYFSLFPIYPSLSIGFHQLRDDNMFFVKWYTERPDYKVSDKDFEIFEDELVEMNKTQEVPFEHLPITVSTSNKVADKVYGITAFRNGADYCFPVRMMVNSVEEFRQHMPMIVKGATGHEFSSELCKLVSDAEIKAALVDDLARRFLFRRAITESISYFSFTSRYAIWVGCVSVCYGIFWALAKTVGSAFAFIVAAPAACALFYFAYNFHRSLWDLELDRKVFTLGEDYAKGCQSFLTSCINFGLLMNRITKAERGKPFTADGNPTQMGQMAYTTRLEFVNDYIKRKQITEKAKQLRQV